MNIYQICQNSPDLLALLSLLIVLCVLFLLIIRNVRRFQHDIKEWGRNISYGTQEVPLGDDGETQESKLSEDAKNERKKKDTIPSVTGCLWQQFIIAIIGLATAILTLLAVSNPLVSVMIESICTNMVINAAATPIPTTLEPTILPSQTPLSTLSDTPTSTLSETAIPTSTFTPRPTITSSPRPTESPSSTLVVTTISPSETLQNPSLTPSSASESSPTVRRYLTRVSVPGNSSDGTRIIAEQTGTYEIRYVSGAYSTNASDEPPWRTAIFAYIENIQWVPDVNNLQKLSETQGLVFRVADQGSFWSAQAAENAAANRWNRVTLREGQILILVTVDHLGFYSDNIGEVILDIYITN